MLLAHSGQLEEAEKIFVDIYNQTDAKSKDREMLLLRARGTPYWKYLL